MLRSPFAALSGFTDEFATVQELCDTVCADVFLEEPAIHCIRIYPQETKGVPWNAYTYDFFKHGDLSALARDNGIKGGDVWFHLKDFSLVLANVVTSLENFIGGTDVDDADMVDIQDAGDVLEEERFNDESEAQTWEAPMPSTAAPEWHNKVVTKKGKQKMTDSEEENSDEAVRDSPVDASYAASSGGGSMDSATSWTEDDGKGLDRVHKAFKLLQQEVDAKFRKYGLELARFMQVICSRLLHLQKAELCVKAVKVI